MIYEKSSYKIWRKVKFCAHLAVFCWYHIRGPFRLILLSTSAHIGGVIWVFIWTMSSFIYYWKKYDIFKYIRNYSSYRLFHNGFLVRLFAPPGHAGLREVFRFSLHRVLCPCRVDKWAVAAGKSECGLGELHWLTPKDSPKEVTCFQKHLKPLKTPHLCTGCKNVAFQI